MRRHIIAGNWKMNKTVAESVEFVRSIRHSLNEIEGGDIVLCPPFTALAAVQGLLTTSRIELGAQNMHWQEKGAYTGEVSPSMVKELCRYVILGHSERRAYFGETDEFVNRKVKAALAHGLVPILCVGETEAEYDARQTDAVVTRMVSGGLAGLTAEQARGIVIAYEPVWAIGTGKAATAAGAGAVAGLVIRRAVAELFDEATAQAVPIQYGGSVTVENIAEFTAHPDIDGALVGGASLKADFVELVRIGFRERR